VRSNKFKSKLSKKANTSNSHRTPGNMGKWKCAASAGNGSASSESSIIKANESASSESSIKANESASSESTINANELEMVPLVTTNPADSLDWLRTPLRMELTMLMGLSICFENVLAQLLCIPIRAVIFLFSSLRSASSASSASSVASPPATRSPTSDQLGLIDLARVFLVLAGVALVRHVPLPHLTDFFRSHRLLKLKVLFVMSEFMVRITYSAGRNILGGFYWSLYGEGRRSQSAGMHAVRLLSSVAYVVVHSLLIIVHLSVLEVAYVSR
jgi:Eukaryotic membrane protein family